MGYDPEIHHRQSIRLKGYDYSRDGLYFITICTWKRRYFLERYPELRAIVERQWRGIEERYHHVFVDEFVIMPDHLHGIIGIGDRPHTGSMMNPHTNGSVTQPHTAGTGLAPAPGPMKTHVKPTIGDIVGSFKSLCVHEWLQYIKTHELMEQGKFWHRNYYEHIIRNDAELERIRWYIRKNPEQWERRKRNLI